MIKPTYNFSAYKLSAFLLFTLSASCYAETQLDLDLAEGSNSSSNSGFYLGLDLTTSLSGEITAKNNDSGDDESADIDVSSTAIFVGYRTESNNRVQLSRSVISVDYDLGGSDDITGIELDFHYVYGQGLVQPYAGFGFGYYTLEDSADAFEDGNDLNGISFQLLGGIKFNLHQYFELDASFHVKSIAWEELVYDDGFDTETVQLAHNYSSLNLGAAYKF